jgi:SAM-dependent methyltransferase
MKRLTRHQDVFGLEMLSYLKGGSPLEIVEREDGYIDAARSTEQYFARFEQWPRRQQRGIAFIRGRNVLDVGCGAGRVSLYLQKKGFRVTAIDRSPNAIRICRQRGVRNARVLDIEDVDRLRGKRFDAVILFGNNFGLFANARKAKRLLGQLYRLTSDGAVIVAETLNPYRTTNPSHRRYQRLNRQRGRMSGQIRIRIRFQDHATPWFDYLFVSPREMKDLLRGTGWKVKRLIDRNRPPYVAIIDKVLDGRRATFRRAP